MPESQKSSHCIFDLPEKLPKSTSPRSESASGNTVKVSELCWKLFNTFEAAEPVWLELEKNGTSRVFQRLDWCRHWFETIGAQAKNEVRIVAGFKGSQAVFLFPLCLETRHYLKRLVWIASDRNDYNAPLSATDFRMSSSDVKEVWNLVGKIAGPCDVLEICKQSPVAGHPIPNAGYLASTLLEENNAYLIDLSADRDFLKNTIHSPETWKKFGKKTRKLQKICNGIEFVEETDSATRADLTCAMLKQKAAELENQGKGNPYSDPRSIDFLVRIAKHCPELMRVFTLRGGGVPIVTTICLQEAQSLLVYQTAFDRRYHACSPGALMLHHLIFKAAEEGNVTLDLSIGDDGYKRSICNRRVSLHRAIQPQTPKGHLFKMMTAARLTARRQVKSNGKLYQAALAFNRRMTST